MGAIPTVSLEALTAAAREENRQAARKITACYRVHCDWIARDAKHEHYSRYGRTEMSVALGCSATVAEAYVSVGVALHTRLPQVKTTFETGEIDLARVRTVCRILDNLSDDIVRSVEAEVVEAARRSSPGPLEQAIWDILLRVAPEEAAALREFAKKFRTVTYSPAGELARIRAELTAPEAAAAWQLLEEMADTLCPKDPRGKKERLCDAFMARMHGEPRLACLCQRTDCPKTEAVLPDRRVPLTMITVDIATLIGLLANPAYLAGHGSIDPDLARELARNSHWQILLTEAVTLAEKLGLAVQNPETGQWERRSDSEKASAATEPETETEKDEDAGLGLGLAADSAADADEGNGSEADSRAATDSSTEPTPASAPAPAPAPGNTSTPTPEPAAPASAPAPPQAPAPAPAPAPESPESPESPETLSDEVDETGETGDAEENDESIPAPATDPPATPDPDTDPVRKHAATRAGTPVIDPPAQATSATGPDVAASPEPASASLSPAGQTPPAPDITSNCSESHSPTTPSDSSASGATSARGPEPGTGPTDAATAASDNPRQRRLGSLTSAAALFCTHTPVGRGTRHSSALDLDDIRHPAHNMRALDLRSAI
ncbi:DUF222 domain-containing protein [Rhodococcus cercidiphylli]|uniref:DUF222 domain-containing protein n=1 Tax=Rhodococcus cercidiphylli TaxID=489916 RepID=A0ABU4AXI6_9NOCA|nr:DUF222 domain-containing protein [Rhodococcus cercidiphylli]MDV6230957.1 DUF222 domain-containing protein [Rhodococcus cercidiphylli]